MLKDYYRKGVLEGGCDEAGRGCLAGPVYAAVVVAGEGFDVPGLDDSKKLTEKQRYDQREIIMQQALAWAVASADNREIDRVNIREASIMAMHRAIDKLRIKPGHLIIDGNYFIPYNGISYDAVTGGDSMFKSIAAASVLAKTFRDDYMKEIHAEHPYFGWDRNKGYPTRQHRAAIYLFGTTVYHRRTFSMY
jgi:ribonuclease HII